MKTHESHSLIPALLLVLAGLSGVSEAGTHVWNGPSGGNWSVAGNWTGGVPTSGEVGGTIVQFGANTTSVQNIANLVVDQIHFTGTGNTINGTTALGVNGATLAVNIQDDAGGNTLGATLPLAFSGAGVEAAVAAGVLTIAGNMSGGVGFICAGPGTVTITSLSNTYTGSTTVTGGTLKLNSNASNTAIPGALVIGNGFGAANNSIVQWLQSTEVADASAVTVNSDGKLDLNNFNEVINTLTVNAGNVNIGTNTLTLGGILTMTGGTITATGTGRLSLGGNIAATSSAAAGASITGNVALNATRTATVNSGAMQPELTIIGVIQDGGASSGIFKAGTGTLDLLSATGNTYTGTTDIDKGVMEMNASAGVIVPGTLIIGNGADMAGSATVREKVQSNDIASTAAITINGSGVLDMNNESDVVGALGGMGSILMQTSSALTVNSNNTTSTFGGSINGTGGAFFKAGTGMLTLTGNNPFAGGMFVNAGTLALNSNGVNTAVQGALTVGTGFGAANSAVVRLLQGVEIADASSVTVMKDGLFDLNGFSETVGPLAVSGNVTMETAQLVCGPITLTGGSIVATTGALNLGGDVVATSSAAAGAVITCPINLNASRTITVNAGAIQPELTITGVIANGAAASGITKTGIGALALNGSASNTFSGTTKVDKGLLQLSDTIGFILPGPIVIGNAVDSANTAILRELQSADIAATSTLTINPSGQLDLNGHSDAVAALSGSGSLNLGAGSLSFGSDNSNQAYGGVISGSGGVFKFGAGVQTFSANNTYTGTTFVSAGALLVTGSQPGSAVSVSSGATLGGTGVVGNVMVVASTVSPGFNGSGQLSTGNLTLDAASTIFFNFSGPGQNGLGSLNVTGTVNLGGCTLNSQAGPNFSGTSGASIVLIANDGVDAITATFKNKAEGTILSLGSQMTTLSYVGGTGNDATLTFMNIPPMLTGPVSAAPTAPTVGQMVTFSAPAGDANNDPLTYAWNFGDGANGSGATPTHIYSAIGVYMVNVMISDGHGGSASGSVSVTVSVALPPMLTSAPFATPSPAGVGQTVSFTAAASSPNTGPISYAWSFGDGSNGSGATVTHAYAAAGGYTVNLVVTDGQNMTVSGSTFVQVNAPLVGEGNDSDGDGFSDGFEQLAGTDPNDPSSTPTGGPASAGGLLPLTVSKANVKLNFSGGGKDAITFSGTLAIPAGFNPSGAKVLVDVGGVSKSLTLTSKAMAVSGGDSIKIMLKSKKGAVAAQTAKYTVAFKNGSFAQALAAAGLTGNADVKNASKSLVITVVFDKTILQKQQTLSYTAKKGKTGMAK